MDDSDSEEESGSPLRTTLWENSCESTFTNPPKRFVPRGAIESIVTVNDVQTTLGMAQDDPLVQYVMDHAKQAFAIAVYARIDVKQAMKWFAKTKKGDNSLPFTYTKGKVQWRGDFCDNQWTFLAPPFQSTKHNHDFVANEILPFTEFSLVSQDGAFGDVYRTVIHDRHVEPASPVDEEHDLSPSPVSQLSSGKIFAVKKIKPQQDQEEVAKHWEREVLALRMMNDLKQEHIVRFVTAFRRIWNGGEEHYVMFEWASGGNLRRMWKDNPSPPLTSAMVKHVIKQILGLATALAAAHNLRAPGFEEASYRHGDLKPENILVFKDGSPFGTLKIGDWGEARYHGKVTAIRPSRTITKFGTRRYEAPEVEVGVRITRLGQSMKRRSRLGDVWALGCITLEFIVWLLYGRKGLDQFNSEVSGETFYQIEIKNGKRVAHVHRVAVKWMERMAKVDACEPGETALGELLEFVQSSLLVVNLPQRLGSNIADQDYERPREDLELGPKLLYSPQVDNLSSDNLSLFEEPIGSNVPVLTLTRADSVNEADDEDVPIQQEPGGGGPYRCHASLFRDRMEGIFDDDTFWNFTDQGQLELPEDLANVPDEDDLGSIDKSFDEQTRGDYASPELDENQWDLHVDNGTALKIFETLESDNVLQTSSVNKVSILCSECCKFRDELRDPGFHKNVNVRHVQMSSRQCDLCKLLWKTIQRDGIQTKSFVRFERDRAFLKMNESHYPVLSLVRDPVSRVGVTAPHTMDCQVGLVNLPKAGGIVHLELIRNWLRECDGSHECKPTARSESNGAPMLRMPTRLIDVGLADGKMVRLCETGVGETDDWIALSHRWGQRNFATTKDNVKQHISEGLVVDKLPATFRDAIIVTRALRKRYLWIDSICIIQGKDGDFQTESRRMADVYSGAYCVLAASCAVDHYDGFLKTRDPRDHVTLAHEGNSEELYYLCESLDNFKGDVLDGALNSRGWVLQEHALARRTIFFADTQTYFECECGVRCETSTKLTNSFAEFLGDPDFPNRLLRAKRGEQINRVQKLFVGYSNLGLTKAYDRPVAIDGLLRKLMETINLRGNFGIVEHEEHQGWFRRSLLWCRNNSSPGLSRINFPTERSDLKVPSWSWMAYNGSIDYLRPDFNNYLWEDIQSPWSHNATSTTADELIAKAWDYNIESAGFKEAELTLDGSRESPSKTGMCIVLGKAKGSLTPECRHWVLLIRLITHLESGTHVKYERIGAGYIPGKCLSQRDAENFHVR